MSYVHAKKVSYILIILQALKMLKTLVLVVAIFTAQSLIHVNKFSRNVMDPKSCQNFAKPTQKTPEPSKVEPKRSINLANLVQLVLMGAGAPGMYLIWQQRKYDLSFFFIIRIRRI